MKYTGTIRRAHLTSRLEKQGAQAAGSYAYQLRGVYGADLVSYRRKRGAASSTRTRGRCLTTLLEMEAPGADPGAKFIKGTFGLCLQQWRDRPELRAGICRAWPIVRAKLEAVPALQRSRHVRGSMFAVLTHLLNLNWVPRSPTAWDPPSAPYSSKFPDHNFSGIPALHSFHEFLQEIGEASMLQFWAQAERRFDGEGIGAGTDSYSLRRLLRQLRVASGISWGPSARGFAA